jgi:hypothetical protein
VVKSSVSGVNLIGEALDECSALRRFLFDSISPPVHLLAAENIGLFRDRVQLPVVYAKSQFSVRHPIGSY